MQLSNCNHLTQIRQCALIKGAGEKEEDVPFTVDDPNFCKEINMKAYQHALDSASSEAIERQQQKTTFQHFYIKINLMYSATDFFAFCQLLSLW